MCKILVVDDRPDSLETLAESLADEGYAVTAVKNESETLEKIIEERFDYAVIDVRLHGDDDNDESGIALAMAIRQIAPDIQIVMLSRFIKAEQVVRAIRYHGVVSYVDKNTQSWVSDVVKALSENSKANHSKSTGFLHLFLDNGHPLMVSSRGRQVTSGRSANNLKIDLDYYSRKADRAGKNWEDLRFDIKDVGERLWIDVFDNHLIVATTYASASAKNDILSLVFVGAADMLGLPVEFLFPGDDYLALKHPMTRFVTGAVPKREPLSPGQLARTKKIRVLLIASNTKPTINGVDREIAELKKLLETRSFIEVTTIPTERATYDRVRKEFAKPDYDIIHYAGHGHFVKNSPEESKLYFWSDIDKQGSVKEMSSAELKFCLESSETRLFYMSACEGTASSGNLALQDDDFLGLADAVVKAGVPSVIGYRWPVSDSGAEHLAVKFYESLIEQGDPQVALLNARRYVAGLNRDDPTWLSPIMIHQDL